jgi:hypothetical protein
MDPDASLAVSRTAVQRWRDVVRADGPNRYDLALDALEAAIALDQWLSSGGYLPAAWHHVTEPQP